MKKKLSILLLTVLLLLAGMGLVVSPARAASKLTDIAGNWASAQIIYLVNIGAISGYGDGSFRPDSYISRAEFIAIVNQAFQFNATASENYSDVNPEQWYYAQITRAVAAGYLPDYDGGIMAPTTQISREEAAYMLAGVLKLDTSSSGSLTYQDASQISGWCRNAVAALGEAGILKGYPDGTFRPSDPINRAEASAIIYNGLKLNNSISPVTADGYYNVKDYGATGNGTTDDTYAIQRAVNEASYVGGGTVYIPDGTYLVNPQVGVKLRSNIKLNLASNATLQAMSSASEYYDIIRILNVTNVEVVGGKIIGDRFIHQGTTGEWGSGISILGSTNIRISDIEISDCWGDGIFIDRTMEGTGPWQDCSENVTIERFYVHDNRRQGISVISAKNLIIRDGEASYSNGTAPESGIDLEPDYPWERLENILIENVITKYNAIGILVALPNYNGSANVLSVTIKNCTDIGSPYPISYYQYYESPTCKITVIGDTSGISSYHD